MATAAKRFTSPGLLTNPSASIGETKRRLIYALLDKFYCPSLRSVNEYRRIAACVKLPRPRAT